MAEKPPFCYPRDMIKAIYFDYHGVLDRRNFHGLVDVIAGAAGQPDPKKISAVLASEVYAYASGEIPPHQFWRSIEERYGTTANRAGRQYQLHVEPVLDVWNIVSSLHDRFALGLLSDCSSDKKETIRSAYALTEYFDYLLFSCDAHTNKQHAAFYQLMLQNGVYQPDECLLIDDEEKNCTKAMSAGFQVHVYRDIPTLRDYLQTL